MNFGFSKMRLKATTLGCLIVDIIVDSFFRIDCAVFDSFSFAIIFSADPSFVTLFLT